MAHKFYLSPAVEYRPPRGIFAPRGAYVGWSLPIGAEIRLITY
jgi:hypothetical protein